MSAELLLEGTPQNHYLIYDITKKFLLKYPNFCKLNIEAFSKIARKTVFLLCTPIHTEKESITQRLNMFICGAEKFIKSMERAFFHRFYFIKL